MKGFKHIAVKGDSDFVINQFGKPWETTDLQLRNLCLEAMKLSRSFHSFSMEIIPMVMVYLVIWTTKLSFSVGYYFVELKIIIALQFENHFVHSFSYDFLICMFDTIKSCYPIA
jgi:hypothetical protein